MAALEFLAFLFALVVTAAPIVAYWLVARLVISAIRSSWGDNAAGRAKGLAIALSVMLVGGYVAGRPLYFNHVCATEANQHVYATVSPVKGIRLDPDDRMGPKDPTKYGMDYCNTECRRFLGADRYEYVEFQVRPLFPLDAERYPPRFVRWSVVAPEVGECDEDNEGRTLCLRKEIIPAFSARHLLTRFTDWAAADIRTWQQERPFGIEGYKYYVVDTTTRNVLGTIGHFNQTDGWFPLFNYWVEMAITSGPVGVKFCGSNIRGPEQLALLQATAPSQPH